MVPVILPTSFAMKDQDTIHIPLFLKEFLVFFTPVFAIMPTEPGRRWGRFQVSLLPMLEQRIARHTLNSVLKISNTGTLFSMFPTKSIPYHHVLINSIFFKTVKNLLYSSIMVPSLYFFPLNHSVYLSDLRKPTFFSLKCHFSDP